MYKHIGNPMISYFSKCYSEGTYGNFMDVLNRVKRENNNVSISKH